MRRSDNFCNERRARYYILALVCAGLLLWIVTGCGGGRPSGGPGDGPSTGNPDGTVGETSLASGSTTKDPDETDVEASLTKEPTNETTNDPGETAIGDLLRTLNEILVQVRSRQESFADAGNARGAQLMAKAAEDVEDMQMATRELDSAVPASANGTTTSEEIAATPERQKIFDAIEENHRQLESYIEEARSCCGLSPTFLDERLEELDNDIEAVRTEYGMEPYYPEATTGGPPSPGAPGETTGATQSQYDSE